MVKSWIKILVRLYVEQECKKMPPPQSGEEGKGKGRKGIRKGREGKENVIFQG